MFWIQWKFDIAKLYNNYWRKGFLCMFWIHRKFDIAKLCNNY